MQWSFVSEFYLFKVTFFFFFFKEALSTSHVLFNKDIKIEFPVSRVRSVVGDARAEMSVNCTSARYTLNYTSHIQNPESSPVGLACVTITSAVRALSHASSSPLIGAVINPLLSTPVHCSVSFDDDGYVSRPRDAA